MDRIMKQRRSVRRPLVRCSAFIAGAVLVLSWATSGCADVLVDAGAPDTPASNFEVFWKEFDRLYPFFDLKQVSWSAARVTYGARAEAVQSEEELLAIMAELVRFLNDGHVFLMTPDTLIRSVQPRSELHRFDLERAASYAEAPLASAGDGKIHYGRMPDDIGYIYFSSWSGTGAPLSAVGSWVHDFDIAIDALGDVRGLILDVRDNSGGSYFNGRFVAGRFTTEPVLATYSQFRNGRDHDDFTPLEAWLVQPRARHVNVPVALLTDGRTASAAEWFVLAMRRMRNVTVVGSTTAGAMGTRVRRILPNGWTFGLPVQRLYSADLKLLEEVGIAPDVPVAFDTGAPPALHDPVLERALEILR